MRESEFIDYKSVFCRTIITSENVEKDTSDKPECWSGFECALCPIDDYCENSSLITDQNC